MTARGVHFALSSADEQRLLSAAGDDLAVLDVMQEEIEERWDRHWLCETDKAWDAIHRCLTDGSLRRRPTTPERMCVLGGRQLYGGADYIVSFVTAQEVVEVSAAIERLTRPVFRERYESISPREYGMPLSEDDFGYTWSYFEQLRELYRKAAGAGRSVVFSVDQ